MNSFNGAPYDIINAYNSIQSPSTVHVKNTTLALFFARYLLQRAISVFKWKIPEAWDRDYLLYTLYVWGYIGIIDTEKFGVIPQYCGFTGYDVFYRPNKITVSNSLLPYKEYRCSPLDKSRKAVLMKLCPDYCGIMDMVSYYSDMLALACEAVGMNLVNSKLSYVFSASDKQTAETMKKMFDEIAGGNPAVFPDKKIRNPDGSKSWEAFEQHVGTNYIASDVLSDMRKIMAMFDTEIGIPNANIDKKERLVTSEVESNNFETISRVSLWLESLQKSCREAQSLFGIDITVDWRLKDESVGNDNGSIS